jgi:chromosome segregation ATPase
MSEENRNTDSVISSSGDDPILESVSRGDTRWYVTGMVFLAFLALCGQGMGIFSMLGYNTVRAEWDAEKTLRREIEKEIRSLKNLEAAARAETSGATKRKEEIQEDLALCEANLGSLRESLRQSERKRADTEATATQYLATVEVEKQIISKLQKQKRDFVKEIFDLENDQQVLVGKVEDLENSKSQREKKLRDLQHDLETTQTDLDNTQKKLNSINRDFGKTQQKLDQAESVLVEAEQKRRDVDSLKNKKTSLHYAVSELENRKSELGNQAELLVKQRKELQTEIEQLKERKTEVTQLEVEKSKLTEQVKSLKEQCLSLNERILERKIQLDGLKKERDSIAGIIAKDANTKKALDKTIKTLNGEKNDIETDVLLLQKKRRQLMELRSETDDNLRKLAEMVLEVTKALQKPVEEQEKTEEGN